MKPKVSDSNENLPKPVLLYSDWWFGTFFIFPYIGNVIIPTDFHIFRRGRSTTNQVLLYIRMHMADEFVANDDHQHHQGTTGLGGGAFKAP